MKSWLDLGHVYLKKYKIIAVFIITFFAWQCHVLSQWYFENFILLQEWQNAPVIGIILGYVQALKMALDHIIQPEKNE